MVRHIFKGSIAAFMAGTALTFMFIAEGFIAQFLWFWAAFTALLVLSNVGRDVYRDFDDRY